MITHEVQFGCEVLAEDPPAWLRSRRLGLLAHQASVNRNFEHTAEVLRKAGGRLECLFSPQHGFYGEKQANMIESDDAWEEGGGIPIFSLYGRTRVPAPEMLERVDVLLVDLQDVGTRVYTYGTTMGLCIEAAARMGVKVVVLDRPNPINGVDIEGNLLQPGCRSFVGRYPIPMRHGLTMGELARFIVSQSKIPCDIDVIPMKGWRRSDHFPDVRRHWILPSPNMPSWESALLYPGMVLLEGTNVSEGRGTTLPFQCFGAPFLDQRRIAAFLKGADLEGAVFRPVSFEPVFDKWKGELCSGFQIHITDRQALRPYRLGLTLIQALRLVHPEEFDFLPPPYEYEYEKLPMDILIGDERIRTQLAEGKPIESIEVEWKEELSRFRHDSEECRIYSS